MELASPKIKNFLIFQKGTFLAQKTKTSYPLLAFQDD